MVETGQAPIRRVRFLPPAPGVGDIEVNTLNGIRGRGGHHEFLTAQRLDFDLLMHIEGGAATHTVDFTEYSLQPGDVLWIRAGQVHHWGSIADVEGTVVMFLQHAIDDRTRHLIRSQRTRLQNHWPADGLAGTSVPQVLDLLTRSTDTRPTATSELHQAALTHCLAALLVQLALVEVAGDAPVPRPTHEAYVWFRDHIEEHFGSWRKVSQYADRLGYSTRTLNRLARENTGLSAKQLIDERVVLEAKRHLSHAEASVSEIAGLLGFDDASNFSSYFHRQTGMTPGTFRTRSRSSQLATSSGDTPT
jgi:AraC-like DNA-binding protein